MVDGYLIDGFDSELFELSYCEVLDAKETPSVRKLQNTQPVFEGSLVHRVFRIIEDPEETSEIFASDVVQGVCVTVGRPRTFSCWRCTSQHLAEEDRLPFKEIAMYTEQVVLNQEADIAGAYVVVLVMDNTCDAVL